MSSSEYVADRAELGDLRVKLDVAKEERLHCAERVAQYTADYYGDGSLGDAVHRYELGKRIDNYRAAYEAWRTASSRWEEARQRLAALESQARRTEGATTAR